MIKTGYDSFCNKRQSRTPLKGNDLSICSIQTYFSSKQYDPTLEYSTSTLKPFKVSDMWLGQPSDQKKGQTLYIPPEAKNCALFDQKFLNVLDKHHKIDLKEKFFNENLTHEQKARLDQFRTSDGKIKQDPTTNGYSFDIKRRSHLTPEVPYTLRQAHSKIHHSRALTPYKLEETQRKEMFLREGGESYKKKLHYPNFQYHKSNIISGKEHSLTLALHTDLESKVVHYSRPMARDNPEMCLREMLRRKMLVQKQKNRKLQPLVEQNIDSVKRQAQEARGRKEMARSSQRSVGNRNGFNIEQSYKILEKPSVSLSRTNRWPGGLSKEQLCEYSLPSQSRILALQQSIEQEYCDVRALEREALQLWRQNRAKDASSIKFRQIQQQQARLKVKIQ